MAEDESIASREAQHGEKMIEVRVRFWTNDISPEPGRIIPKHAWTSGVVRITSNESHGITKPDAIPFQSLLDVGTAIEQTLIENGIILHHSRVMRKYLAPEPESE